MDVAVRCRNAEIFHLLFDNGIGINRNSVSAVVKTFNMNNEKSEEEKLEKIKMLSKIPEFTTAPKVWIVGHV